VFVVNAGGWSGGGGEITSVVFDVGVGGGGDTSCSVGGGGGDTSCSVGGGGGGRTGQLGHTRDWLLASLVWYVIVV